MSSEKEFRAVLDKHIARRIKDRRNKIRMSLSELDDAIGASPGTSARLEHAVTMVDCVRLVNLCHALGVHVSYFFDDLKAISLGTPFASPEPDEQMELEAFIEAFYGVDDYEARREILGLMKAVAESDDLGDLG